MSVLPRIPYVRLGGGEARYGYAEGRAGHVRKSRAVEEFHAERISAVFAANSEFDVRTGRFALFRSHFYQLTHAVLVRAGELI